MVMREFHPDVVFSDIAMPMMDGYHLAERIRHLDGATPFMVALTGYGQKHDKQRAFEAGFNAHLVKPTSMEDLRNVMEDVGERGCEPLQRHGEQAARLGVSQAVRDAAQATGD
jgi:CheY-like chemotaxis protein